MEDWEEDLKVNLNDCYCDINGIKLTDNEINKLYNELPDVIKRGAKEWGGYDKFVSEKICNWIEKSH